MGEERNVYKVLVGKPAGKRPLGRPRHRWEDGIRMDLREIGLGGCGLDSNVSGQGPVAGCCECGDEPSGSCATELVSQLVRRNLFYGFNYTKLGYIIHTSYNHAEFQNRLVQMKSYISYVELHIMIINTQCIIHICT
jgi:hypothetical protein